MMTEWQHIPAGQLPNVGQRAGRPAPVRHRGRNNTEHRELLTRFVDRLAENRRDVFAQLRGVEFARSIPWISMKFENVPASMDGLWEQQIGGVKVLILANRDRQSDNDPSHILYFVEGEQTGARARRSAVAGREHHRIPDARRHHSLSAAASRGMPVWIERRCAGVGTMSAEKSKASITPAAEKPASLPAAKLEPTEAEQAEVRALAKRKKARAKPRASRWIGRRAVRSR